MSNPGHDSPPQQTQHPEEPQQPQQSAIRRHAGAFSAAFFLAVAGALATGLADDVTSWVKSLFAEEKSPPVTQTDFRHYLPFDLREQPVAGLKVVGRQTGSRPSISFNSSAPNTWRCFSGDRVDDPCYAPEMDLKPKYLLCPGTPWEGSAWRVDINSLPEPDSYAAPEDPWGKPWALEVQVPDSSRHVLRCVTHGGTLSSVLGKTVWYVCLDDDGGETGYLVGLPEKTSEGPWMVALAPRGATQIVQAPIKTMWQ
ncbi:hypothetical protein QF037_004471 [Streptomyces canus]|nr:hypothetical protein [Streptomyces canus]